MILRSCMKKSNKLNLISGSTDVRCKIYELQSNNAKYYSSFTKNHIMSQTISYKMSTMPSKKLQEILADLVKQQPQNYTDEQRKITDFQNKFKKQIQKSKKQPPKIHPYLQNLSQQLLKQPSYFIAPIHHLKTYHYASYILSVINRLREFGVIKEDHQIGLICFRQIKKCIMTSNNVKFTPKSITRLLEQFSKLQFEGDQGPVIEKIAEFGQSNYLQFPQQLFQRFYTAYKSIMVDKAFGPVKFRPLSIQKKYKCEIERRSLIVNQKISQFLRNSEQKNKISLQIDLKQNKKWMIIKIPLKKLYIITYPQKYQQFTHDQTLQYIYDVKQLVHKCISRQRFSKKVASDIWDFQIETVIRTNNEQIDEKYSYQFSKEQGLIYKSRKQVNAEVSTIHQLRNYSLRDKIQKMKEKKKQLKDKNKNKGKQQKLAVKLNLTKNGKQIDLFQSLKQHLKQMNDQEIEKIVNRLNYKRQRRLAKLMSKQSQNQKQQDQIQEQQQEEQQNQAQNSTSYSNQLQAIQKLNFLFKKVNQDVKNNKEHINLIKKNLIQELNDKKIQYPNHQIIKFAQTTSSTKQKIDKIQKQYSLKQLKEFQAYIQLVQFLYKGIRLNKYETINSHNQKDNAVNDQKNFIKRFNLVNDFINEKLDTGVSFGRSFQQIFPEINNNCENQLKLTPEMQGNQNDQKDQENLKSVNKHKIYVISEKELMTVIENSQSNGMMRLKLNQINKKQTKKLQKQNKNVNKLTNNKNSVQSVQESKESSNIVTKMFYL